MGYKPKKEPAKNGQILQYNTIKARLYPTPEQAKLFEKTFGCCRFIWNQMLSDHERFYIETGKHFIPTPAKYKKAFPFLTEVDHQALTQEYQKLSQAFRVFFKNQEAFGYPKFKRKKEDRNTYSACNQFWNDGASSTIYITKNAIRMTKVGFIKASFSRRPRSGWRLTRITIERTKGGKYYGYLLYECPAKVPESVIPIDEMTIGLKYSISHFYVADNGEMADPPHWLERSQEKLAEIQRKLRRMQPGSKNYQEMVRKYRLMHEHIANQRYDFIHKESRRIANEWDAVCVREDSLAVISEALGGKYILSSGYGMFREMLRYKLERQGKQLIIVDRFCPTTKTCSVCGLINETLDPRALSWTCGGCGTRHKREVNAAANVKAQGLSRFRSMQEDAQSA